MRGRGTGEKVSWLSGECAVQRRSRSEKKGMN